MNDSKDNQWTIKDLLAWATDDFKKRGIDTPRLDAEILLANALKVKRVDLYIRFDQVPDPDALEKFRETVKRRRAREPVAHILGVRAFHDIELLVPAGLFVPRPETELLVDEAVSRLKTLGSDGPKILDIGAGTGSIALALACAIKGLKAFAVDIDPDAVKAVKENADRLGLGNNVVVLTGDMFAPVQGLGPFDLVACNPPYVPTGEIPGLMPEVKDHEPARALDGGEDGLDFIRRLMAEAHLHINPGGWLLLEVGEGQAQKVADLAGDNLMHEFTRVDLAGCPRIVVFKKIQD